MIHEAEASQEIGTVQKLAQMRDDLKVQLHLAKAEVRDEWDHVLEPKWKELQRKVDAAETASTVAAKEIYGAVRLLARDLAEEYERFRKTL